MEFNELLRHLFCTFFRWELKQKSWNWQIKPGRMRCIGFHLPKLPN